MVADRDGTWFRARDLSDGTLRFLALSVLEMDSAWGGLVCMEEPENGIHPSRIKPMLRLLESLAVDVECAVDESNPLRQVIFNTHSPDVVGLTRDEAMLFAGPMAYVLPEGRSLGLSLRAVPGTWRAREGGESVSKGEVLSFLKALPLALAGEGGRERSGRPVATRAEYREQMSLPFLGVAERPK